MDEVLLNKLKDTVENSKTWEESLMDLFDGDVEKVQAFIKHFNDSFWDMLM